MDVRTGIIEWNRKRNQLRFDPNLEAKLLSDEAREFFMAETVEDRLHEAADFFFVLIGTVAKYVSNEFERADDLLRQFSRFNELESWGEKVGFEIREQLERDGTRQLLLDAMQIVLEANQAKLGVKDASGKIIKGADYVSPIEKIHQLIESEPCVF